MALAGAAWIPVRREGAPLPHAHEEAEGPLGSPDRVFDAATHLHSRLGPVLYQLPPRWSIDLERLETFVAALPRRHVNNDTGGHAPRDAVRLRQRLHTRLAIRPAS